MCVCGAANVARAGQLWRCVGCGEGPVACAAEVGPGEAVGLLWVVGGVEGTG